MINEISSDDISMSFDHPDHNIHPIFPKSDRSVSVTSELYSIVWIIEPYGGFILINEPLISAYRGRTL